MTEKRSPFYVLGSIVGYAIVAVLGLGAVLIVVGLVWRALAALYG